MKGHIFRLFSVFLLGIGLIGHFFLRPFILGTKGEEIVFHYLFFLIAIILFLRSFKYSDKPESNVWSCENCNIELRRPQIKFGLCPKCGKKVKNFKGKQSLLLK